MISYEGLFFEAEAEDIILHIEKTKLEKKPKNLHCTFKYRPTKDEVFEHLAGKKFEIELVGYACDGYNSGFQVRLPDALKDYYINYDKENPKKLKTPHITTSLKKDALAVNTKNLDFKPLPTPIIITGKFGFYTKEKNREYITYSLESL